MSTVLIATDGSPAAEAAVETVLLASVSLALLRRARRPVLVVHSTPAPVPVA